MCTYRGSYADLLVEHYGYTREEAEAKQRELYEPEDPVRRARLVEIAANNKALGARLRSEGYNSPL